MRDIPEDTENVAIIDGIIAMSKGMGLNVVAEGVETKEHEEFLKTRDCDYIQGFYLGRPVPAAEFERQFLWSSGYRAAYGGGNIAFFKPRTTDNGD